MHTIEPTLAVSELLAAISRSANTYDSAAIDLGKYVGVLHFLISAGTFGGSATLDAKIQESDASDFGSGVSDISGAAVTQMTAAGTRELTLRVRKPTKRYVRLRVTVATAAVVSAVVLVAQPLKAE